jgi:hypothetical protein
MWRKTSMRGQFQGAGEFCTTLLSRLHNGTKAFSIRRPVGRRRGVWWRKWSFMLGSCSRESDSS